MFQVIEYRFFLNNKKEDEMSFRVSIIKKNQILTWSLIIMLGVAGYVNYRNDPSNLYAVEVTGMMDENLGDAVFVDGKNIVTTSEQYIIDVGDKGFKMTSDEFFAESRINRNNEYAKQIETYEKIVLSANTDKEQKEFATNEIKRINDEKNAISVAENLIRLKGFEESVILKNADSLNVIVLDEDLTDSKVAQIQNIVQNELGMDIEDIHINSLTP